MPLVGRPHASLFTPLLRERSPAHEAGLVAPLYSPGLLEQKNLQPPAGYEVGQLTLLQQVLRTGPVVALEVAQGRLAEDEDTTTLESARRRRQNGAIEEMVHENDVPQTAHEATGLEIPSHGGQGDLPARRPSPCVIQGDLGSVNDGHLQTAFGEPHGVPSRPSRDVEGATRARKEPAGLDHERGRLGAARPPRPATVPSRCRIRRRINFHHVYNGTGDGCTSSGIASWAGRTVTAGNLGTTTLQPETL